MAGRGDVPTLKISVFQDYFSTLLHRNLSIVKLVTSGMNLVLFVEFPVFQFSIPVLRKVFPVNLRREFRKICLRHSGFLSWRPPIYP
jgi:hypothetical protein